MTETSTSTSSCKAFKRSFATNSFLVSRTSCSLKWSYTQRLDRLSLGGDFQAVAPFAVIVSTQKGK